MTMMPWLLAMMLGAPILDPIEGASLEASERERLPSGRSLASIADVWFVELVNTTISGGGIALFDPVRLSSHGRSWTQQRYFLDGMEITDPGVPGAPLIEIPHRGWQSLRYRSLWASAPGFEWKLPEPKVWQTALRGSFGADVGGGTWVPRDFMDREPATSTGATPIRRSLAAGWELDGAVAIPVSENQRWRVFAERIDHNRTYPTLRTFDGEEVDDTGGRSTVLGQGSFKWGALPIATVLAWQRQERSHEGAQWRHPLAYTRRGISDRFLAQATTSQVLGEGPTLTFGLGWGFARDRQRDRAETPWVFDIEDQWLWQARVQPLERTTRHRLNAQADLAWQRDGWESRVGLLANQSFIDAHARWPGSFTGTSYRRGPEAGVSVAQTVTEYEAVRSSTLWLQSARASAETKVMRGGWTLRGTAAVDYSGAGVSGGRAFRGFAPAVGLALQRRLGGGEVFVLGRREPLILNREIADFLDPNRLNARVYRWNDDGDGVPEAGEQGALLRRTGGRYHRIDSALARPASNQVAFGWRTPKFGPFRAVFTGIARFLTDRLTVRYRGDARTSFTPTSVQDPGGDGLGENSSGDGPGQALTVFARNPGTEGTERYALVNDEDTNYYIGSEIQLYTPKTERWFFTLGASGYWNVGTTPFGIFSDRNDPGIIDAVTADPNARLNERGRIDAGRAFGINLTAGFRPIARMSVGTAIRYRDGEPMTRMFVAPNLPQGPVAVMAVPRGDPVPRFTFHLTWDVRLRYDLGWGPWSGALVFDVMNLLGSGTEINEDVRTGDDFRRSLEMVPGRTALVSLELDWQP